MTLRSVVAGCMAGVMGVVGGCVSPPVRVRFTAERSARMYVTQAPDVTAEFASDVVVRPGAAVELKEILIPAACYARRNPDSALGAYPVAITKLADRVSAASPLILTFRDCHPAEWWYFGDCVVKLDCLRSKAETADTIEKSVSPPLLRYASILGDRMEVDIPVDYPSLARIADRPRSLKEISDSKDSKMEIVFEIAERTRDQPYRLEILDKVRQNALPLPTSQLLKQGKYVIALQVAGEERLTGLVVVRDTSHEMVKFTMISAMKEVSASDLAAILKGETEVKLYQSEVEGESDASGQGKRTVLAEVFLGNRASPELVRLARNENQTIEVRFSADYEVELWDWEAERWRNDMARRAGDPRLVLPLSRGSGREEDRSYVRIRQRGTEKAIYGMFDVPPDIPLSAMVASFRVQIAAEDFQRISGESTITKVTGTYAAPENPGFKTTVYQLTLGRRNPSESIRQIEQSRGAEP